MERYVCDAYPVRVTVEDAIGKLAVLEDDTVEAAAALFARLSAVARPKSVYRVCYIDDIAGDAVTVGQTVFHSKTLARRLQGLRRAFAYVVTCGREADELLATLTDPVERIWLDILKEMLLGDARAQFIAQIKDRYGLPILSSMAPGSGNLDTWPLAQQRQLFSLIGSVEEDIGVTLTGSLLMVPNKTVSGLLFATDREHIGCALCRRENCVGRQTPYTPGENE